MKYLVIEMDKLRNYVWSDDLEVMKSEAVPTEDIAKTLKDAADELMGYQAALDNILYSHYSKEQLDEQMGKLRDLIHKLEKMSGALG